MQVVTGAAYSPTKGRLGLSCPRAAPRPHLPVPTCCPGRLLRARGGAPGDAQAHGQPSLGRRWGPGRSREALRPALPQARRHERTRQRPRASCGAPRPGPSPLLGPLPSPPALSVEPRPHGTPVLPTFPRRVPPHPCARRLGLPGGRPNSLGGGGGGSGVAELAGPGTAAPSLLSSELRGPSGLAPLTPLLPLPPACPPSRPPAPSLLPLPPARLPAPSLSLLLLPPAEPSRAESEPRQPGKERPRATQEPGDWASACGPATKRKRRAGGGAGASARGSRAQPPPPATAPFPARGPGRAAATEARSRALAAPGRRPSPVESPHWGRSPR